jgi:hypothetical protein
MQNIHIVWILKKRPFLMSFSCHRILQKKVAWTAWSLCIKYSQSFCFFSLLCWPCLPSFFLFFFSKKMYCLYSVFIVFLSFLLFLSLSVCIQLLLLLLLFLFFDVFWYTERIHSVCYTALFFFFDMSWTMVGKHCLFCITYSYRQSTEWCKFPFKPKIRCINKASK